MIITCKKKDGVLTFSSKGKEKYDYIINSVEENTRFDMILYPVGDGDKSISQLAKIHVLIKLMAEETGDSFAEMKIQVKDHAGYFHYNNDKKKIYKSFADATITELSTIIASIVEICDFLGIQNVEL